AVWAANTLLADYQKIRRWVAWPGGDFPRTSTGKPRLEEIALQIPELLKLDGEASPPPDIFAGLPMPLQTNGSLESLSSLDRVELLSALEQRLNVELNEEAFSEAKTFEDLQQLLLRSSSQRKEYVFPRWAQWELVRWIRMVVYYALVWPATK